MARLDDLLPELREHKHASVQEVLNKSENKVITGVKRRAWLDSTTATSEEKQKETLTTKNLNSDDKRKGFIDTVYKPESLCFSDLRSNPLRLFRYLYEITKSNSNDFKTPRVKLREVMIQLDISKDSARTALRFLLKQQFIERIEFHPGQLGWSRYELKKDTCEELEEAILKGSISPFNSSISTELDKTNPTNNDSWESIDISPLESIGFRSKHLLQIKKNSTPEIVQESINHFSYALKYNQKTKEYTNPISAFISVLKRGEAWVEPNYKSPQEIAQQKFIELKKAEIERAKKLEEDLFEIALEEWQQTLSEEEIQSLAPDNRKKGDPTPPRIKLSAYFRKNIWPSKKQSYLNTNIN